MVFPTHRVPDLQHDHIHVGRDFRTPFRARSEKHLLEASILESSTVHLSYLLSDHARLVLRPRLFMPSMYCTSYSDLLWLDRSQLGRCSRWLCRYRIARTRELAKGRRPRGLPTRSFSSCGHGFPHWLHLLHNWANDRWLRGFLLARTLVFQTLRWGETLDENLEVTKSPTARLQTITDSTIGKVALVIRLKSYLSNDLWTTAALRIQQQSRIFNWKFEKRRTTICRARWRLRGHVQQKLLVSSMCDFHPN